MFLQRSGGSVEREMRCNALIWSTWVCAALEEFQFENTQQTSCLTQSVCCNYWTGNWDNSWLFKTYTVLLFFSAFLFAFWKYVWCCFMFVSWFSWLFGGGGGVTVTMISQPHVSDIKWTCPVGLRIPHHEF